MTEDSWDAGYMECGELLVLLRKRVRALAPGGVLHLVARDLGAVEDLPAWRRLTGHLLRQVDHSCGDAC